MKKNSKGESCTRPIVGKGKDEPTCSPQDKSKKADTKICPTGYKNSPLGIIPEDWEKQKNIDFSQLSQLVQRTHELTQSTAVKAINRVATLRNWLIGFYIVEYEQHGQDRAIYGERLLKRLEERVNTKGLTETLFYNARLFYSNYPQVKDFIDTKISPTMSGKLQSYDSEDIVISPTSSEKSVNEISTTTSDKFHTSADKLIANLSFSHIVEILTVNDAFARFFYETECIRCGWSVRELRRQISTNLYFRSGISKNPEKLIESVTMPERQIQDDIRQPFTFEFLGLSAKEIVEEKDLEQALISHLREFILELGKGFCFEARQKRIIIDDKYYYADLVFYHRLLHCSIIIELKNDEFRHEYLGQLNAYVSYYRENEMHDGDNPPVGILLCTHKGKKMVEYAIAGMDNKLFVSTYMLQLPDKATLENFLLTQIEENDKTK